MQIQPNKTMGFDLGQQPRTTNVGISYCAYELRRDFFQCLEFHPFLMIFHYFPYFHFTAGGGGGLQIEVFFSCFQLLIPIVYFDCVYTNLAPLKT